MDRTTVGSGRVADVPATPTIAEMPFSDLGTEAVLAALIAIVGGFSGGWAKTWVDHRYRLRRIRRQRRLASLMRMAAWLREGTYDSVYLRMSVAEVGDRTLGATVERLLGAVDLEERDRALSEASLRIGQLMRR
jgi:hypothetical protein